jgi:hypothetical protein
MKELEIPFFARFRIFRGPIFFVKKRPGRP